MTWEILWASSWGLALSAAAQSVVSKREMIRLQPDDSPGTLAIACGLGATSSSCSNAAVALARSLFRKGANLHVGDGGPASTNLVIELGVILCGRAPHPVLPHRRTRDARDDGRIGRDRRRGRRVRPLDRARKPARSAGWTCSSGAGDRDAGGDDHHAH